MMQRERDLKIKINEYTTCHIWLCHWLPVREKYPGRMKIKKLR